MRVASEWRLRRRWLLVGIGLVRRRRCSKLEDIGGDCWRELSFASIGDWGS